MQLKKMPLSRVDARYGSRSSVISMIEPLEPRALFSTNSVDFTVDSSLSSLTLSGILPQNHATRIAQGAGSLTAHYSGTVGFKVTHTAANVSAIQFNGISDLIAANTGDWKPIGNKPANYGDKAKFGPNGFLSEIYGLALTISSNLTKISKGVFSDALNVRALSGEDASSSGNGITYIRVNSSQYRANIASGQIKLTINPKTFHATITIPISIKLEDDIVLSGSIVASGKI